MSTAVGWLLSSHWSLPASVSSDWPRRPGDSVGAGRYWGNIDQAELLSNDNPRS